jgi:hypothetical protein
MSAPRQYCAVTDVQNMFPRSTAQMNNSQIETAIIEASADVENLTNRILDLETYTIEVPLVMDKDGLLVSKVTEYPIQGVSAFGIRLQGQTSFALQDLSHVDFAMLPERFIYFDGTVVLGSNAYNGVFYTSFNRKTRGFVQITYQAGFNPIPQDVVNSTCILAMNNLMRDANPSGASSIQATSGQAQNSISFTEGETINTKDAIRMLARYKKRE